MFTSCIVRCCRDADNLVCALFSQAGLPAPHPKKHCKRTDFLLNLNMSANGDSGNSARSRIIARQDHE
jgi:hypothetical protein